MPSDPYPDVNGGLSEINLEAKPPHGATKGRATPLHPPISSRQQQRLPHIARQHDLLYTSAREFSALSWVLQSFLRLGVLVGPRPGVSKGYCTSEQDLPLDVALTFF